MIKKLKGWFSKKVGDVELNKTSNLNPIGVARKVDIKNLIKQIEKLKNEIDNFQPPTIDTTNFARVDQENTFTKTNTFNNIVVVNEPTNDNNVANKKYVDKKISQEIDKIPPLDLSNFAEKNKDNVFVNQSINDNTPFIKFENKTENEVYGYIGNLTISNNLMSIKGENGIELKSENKPITITGGSTKINGPTTIDSLNVGSGWITSMDSRDDALVNKRYVDSKSLNPEMLGGTTKMDVRVTKSDVQSGLYRYKFSVDVRKGGIGTGIVDVSAFWIDSKVNNRRVDIQQTFSGIYSTNGTWLVNIVCFSTNDLKPGSTGDFDASFTATIKHFKIFDRSFAYLED